MNENIRKVFGIFGLVPNEIFGINGLGDNRRYKLNSDLQFLFLNSNGEWRVSTDGIGVLLRNTNIILKLPKPSEFEIAILKRCLEKGYECIARDSDGELRVYDGFEIKLSRDGVWIQDDYRILPFTMDDISLIANDNDFLFIKEKSKHNIKMLLRDCGVEV